MAGEAVKERGRSNSPRGGVSRRRFLAGAAVGGGLLAGWALWPDDSPPDLPLAENEAAFGLWLKIATSGQVTLNVAQSEMGQGVLTQLAEIAADELGADWRTMAIQPVGPAPGFANTLLAAEWDEARGGGLMSGGAEAWARDLPFVVTGGSSSIRMFAPLVRQAAATTRVLLLKAASRSWDVDWETLDTENGFVVDRGGGAGSRPRRVAFAELADAAAREDMPDPAPLREVAARSEGAEQERVRLDMPSKLDGSANFAADIRLPNMIFASVRSAPIGATLAGFDEAALSAAPGVIAHHAGDRWIAVAANTWWAADRALDIASPEWRPGPVVPDDASIDKALVEAIGGEGFSVVSRGDVEAEFADQARRVFIETGRTKTGVHAPAETRSVAARVENGRAEIWLASQAPADARVRVAAALDFSIDDVSLYPLIGGGSFGRNYDNDIAAMAALLSRKSGHPVSLMLSRMEDIRMHHFRPSSAAHMTGAVDERGLLTALSVKVAMPSFMVETMARIGGGQSREDARASAIGQKDLLAVEGAVPPYALANLEVAHFPADIGVPTGRFRGNSHNIGTFLIENFIDMLTVRTGAEPLSYRIGMLSDSPRLARCLTRVGEMARWNGGVKEEDGNSMGIACASLRGSHVAVIAEVEPGDAGPQVAGLWACVDAGRIVNVDIARQQVEGGLIFGLGQALGGAVGFDKGRPVERRLSELNVPSFQSTPPVRVEFIASEEETGGIGEIAVPAVAPAIAAALQRIDARHRWTLPF